MLNIVLVTIAGNNGVPNVARGVPVFVALPFTFTTVNVVVVDAVTVKPVKLLHGAVHE
jgi:hypothetical protein